MGAAEALSLAIANYANRSDRRRAILLAQRRLHAGLSSFSGYQYTTEEQRHGPGAGDKATQSLQEVPNDHCTLA
jgi:hypothetical protein